MSSLELPATAEPRQPSRWRMFLGGSVHPWRRFFAKLVDVSVLGVPVMVLVTMAVVLRFPEHASAFTATAAKIEDNILYAGAATTLAWALIEAVFLSTIGTTPGRWIFGIRLRTRTGEKLGFGDAVERSLRLGFAGLGMSIPFINLFTLFISYYKLCVTRSTSWDEAVGSTVSHARWGPARAAACVLAVFAIVSLKTPTVQKLIEDGAADLLIAHSSYSDAWVRLVLAKSNHGLPKMVDEGIRADYVVAGPGTQLTHHFTLVNHPSPGIDVDQFGIWLSQVAVKRACEDPPMQGPLSLGVTSNYIYVGQDGVEVARRGISPMVCGMTSV